MCLLFFTEDLNQQAQASASKNHSRKKLLPKKLKSKNAQLGETLAAIATDLKGSLGRWSFTLDGYEMAVLTDVNADRMRIIAPVIESKSLSRDGLETLLSANFDRALDAKYSINKGVVWATFTHPLNDLTTKEFKSALKQVASLVRTYGTTHSSMDVVFGGRAQ